MRTPTQAAALRRGRIALLWLALACAVVGVALALVTSRGSAAFQVGATLAGVGAGMPVALGVGMLTEKALQALRR